MEKVYKFSYESKGDVVTSQLIASDVSEAYEKLEGMNIDPYELKLDIRSTISLGKTLPLKELARFYETMGKRMSSGALISTGLESAIEFTSDIRLKAAISTLKNATDEGVKIGIAMEKAGFPFRHAKAIGAMEETASTDETFISLAEECRREERMSSGIKKLLRMPKIFGTVVALMFYGAFGFLSPMILEKLVKIVGEDELSPFVSMYYGFVTNFSQNIIISTILYFGSFIAIYVIGKSNFVKKLFDKIKIFHEISERSDMASLWLKYGLMFRSGMNALYAALLVAESAKREDSRLSFIALENNLGSGYDMSASIENAGFPDYIVRAIKAGESSSSVEQSMMDISTELFEDVDMLVSKLTDTVQTMTVIGMAIIVLIFFVLTYYPLLSTIMSQL